MSRYRISTPLLAVVVIASVAVFAYFVVGGIVNERRNAAQLMIAQNNQNQVALGLMTYEIAFGSFPAAASKGKSNEEPPRSWRVVIAPFLEAGLVEREYDRQQSWNSEHNQEVCRKYNLAKRQLGNPRAKNANEYCTNFVVVTGEETLFSLDQKRSMSDIEDDPSTTILLVEIDDSDILWYEPRDLSFNEMSFQINDPDRSKPCIGNRKSKGAFVAMADGQIKFLPQDTPPETLKAMLTIAGGEKVTLP